MLEDSFFAEIGMQPAQSTVVDEGPEPLAMEPGAEQLPEADSLPTEPEAAVEPPAAADTDEARQAEAFRRLTTDPKYRAAYLAALNAANPQPAESAGQEDHDQIASQITARFFPGVDIEKTLDSNVIQAVEAAGVRGVSRTLLPEVLRMDQRIAYLEGLLEKQTITTQYPGADKYLTEAQALRQQNPRLTMEQALRAVAGAELYQKPAKPSGLSQQRVAGQLTSRNVETRQTGAPKGVKPKLLDYVLEAIASVPQPARPAQKRGT